MGSICFVAGLDGLGAIFVCSFCINFNALFVK